MSFTGNRIYLFMPMKDNQFEPPLYKALDSFNTIKKYYNYLNFCIDVAKMVNSNAGIWRK